MPLLIFNRYVFGFIHCDKENKQIKEAKVLYVHVHVSFIQQEFLPGLLTKHEVKMFLGKTLSSHSESLHPGVYM